MLKVVIRVAVELGGMCQWMVFLFVASSVAISVVTPHLQDQSTTISLIVSMAVGVCLEIWSIDKKFHKAVH